MKIYNWNDLSTCKKKDILLRPFQMETKNIKDQVTNIINQVKQGGDNTLIKLTERYDQVALTNLKVTAEELTKADKAVSFNAKETIAFAKRQIEANHILQLPKSQIVETCEGVVCERQSRPIECIGLYIPGGSAPLVSTVLMLGVPAEIAGCTVRILCTPPNSKGEIDPHLLVAARLCGIQSIYKIGGAQAIAAMAYGTETIPKVDKIFGPGNRWVTQAKMQIFADPQGAGIDMPAGPSELMVIADENANSEFIAADLLSQAEHGVDSQVMLVTLSEQFALKVESEVKKQLQKLPRRDIATQSLANSRVIIANNISEAIEISNAYAPEHLILQVDEADKYMSNITNAGAVFLGKWTPETVGDYVTGSNHVLPTYGYARHYSGLSVIDFMKFISFQRVTRQGLERIGHYAEALSDIEGLTAHKQAVSLRLNAKVSQYE